MKLQRARGGALLGACIALSACGGKPGSGAGAGGGGGAGPANIGAPAPAAPVGSLPVDLAALDTTTLVLLRADEAGLTERARVELPDAVEQLVWRTPDELYATLVGGAVVTVQDGQARAVALPPPEAWDRPNPEPGGELERVAMERLHADADGGVWLGRCQWGDIYDGGHCAVWSWARLAPGAPAMADEPRPARAATPWVLEAPAGFALALEAFQPPTDPEEPDPYPLEPRDRVRCAGPDTASVYPDDDAASEAGFAGAAIGPWVSHDPPAYLAGPVYDGLGGAPEYDAVSRGAVDADVSWRLFRACDPEPLAEPDAVELGPAGVWAYSAGGAWRVMLLGRELGALPDNLYAVTFAPPRP
jgi:hypothetical protein